MHAINIKYANISKSAKSLGTDKNVKIFVFCVWQARDEMLMIKIEIHTRHSYWIVDLLNNIQQLGLTSLIQ